MVRRTLATVCFSNEVINFSTSGKICICMKGPKFSHAQEAQIVESTVADPGPPLFTRFPKLPRSAPSLSRFPADVNPAIARRQLSDSLTRKTFLPRSRTVHCRPVRVRRVRVQIRFPRYRVARQE